MDDVTILLVEDDDIDAVSFKRRFSVLGKESEIVRARDGIEALELLETGAISNPYIILSDIQMPRMNGIEFIEKLRSHPVHSDAVVFMLTTSIAPTDISASYRHHVAGYFSKETGSGNFKKVVNMIQDYRHLSLLPS